MYYFINGEEEKQSKSMQIVLPQPLAPSIDSFRENSGSLKIELLVC